jgi:drug/metabolite transporter (DMT)-like permease
VPLCCSANRRILYRVLTSTSSVMPPLAGSANSAATAAATRHATTIATAGETSEIARAAPVEIAPLADSGAMPEIARAAALAEPDTMPKAPAIEVPRLAMQAAAKPARTKIDPRLVLALAAVYLIWSSTYLAIRFAIAELPPLLMAGGRYFAAGLVMLAIARRRGAAWPTARQWLRVLPIGALLFLCGNGFVVLGEQTVSSGGAAVVCATMPLWTGVLAALTGERPSWREWLSLAIGFIGVLVLMGGPTLAGAPIHLVLIMLSPMCWALASVLARRQARTWASGAILSSAMQMLTGGACLMLVGGIRGESFPEHASAGAWLAVVYLAVFGSLIGFTAYNWLLRNARPVVATSYAYVNPILAVVIGAVISGEPLGITTLIANVLIVGAIALALARPASAAPRRT